MLSLIIPSDHNCKEDMKKVERHLAANFCCPNCEGTEAKTRTIVTQSDGFWSFVFNWEMHRVTQVWCTGCGYLESWHTTTVYQNLK